MKWVLSHLSGDHRKWLLQDTQEQAQFTYNLHHHSIRIKANNSRLFFLDVAGGFFQKKIVLLSEYGVAIGETAASTTNGGTVLSLNDFKFIYRWQNNDLLLYDKNGMQLSQVNIEPADSLRKLEEFALLFSQAWVVSSNLSQSKADLKVA